MSSTRNLLADEPLLDVRARNIDAETELRHLVCCVLLRALETLPALVRQWWTTLDRRSSDVVCFHSSLFIIHCQAQFYADTLRCVCCCVGWTVDKPLCFTYLLFTWTVLTTRPSVYLCYYVLLWCRSNGSQAAMLHLSSVLVNSPHYKTLRVSKVWQFVLVRLPMKYSLAMLSVTQRWN